MFLEEGDKLYFIENNKIVAAMSKDAYYGSCPRPDCEHHSVIKYDLGKGSRCKGCGTSMKLTFPRAEEKDSSFDFGDRVTYKHKTGSVFSIIPSVYGTSIGVRFDDDEVGEFLPEELTKIQAKEAANSRGVEGILKEYEEYNSKEAYTLDELNAREKQARSLNLRSKSLLTDKSLSYNERLKLDSIVTATTVDALDLKERKLASHEEYFNTLPKYSMSETFNNWGSLARVKTNEDISWVENLEPEQFDWDSHLSNLASEVAESLTLEQLENEQFMVQAKDFRMASFNKEQQDQFETLLERAIEIKKATTEQMVKEASSEDDGIDFQAVFV